MIKRIAVLGTGLIGGSLGMAIKRRSAASRVVGYDEPSVLDEAVERGAIDERAVSPQTAVADVDLVVLALPLPQTLAMLDTIAGALKPGTLVTDVGSVKQPIVSHAHRVLPSDVVFVGGHPMAGGATGGIQHADALLFENAVYVLCPREESLPPEFEPASSLLTEIGARLLIVDAAKHDRLAAAVSHLPQLLAVSLVETAFEVGRDASLVQLLAAGGFRDMTRIAESPFAVWKGILAANHANVLDALASLTSSVQRIRNRLIEEDYDAIGDVFETAGQRRREIPRDMRGFLHPLHNIMVHVQDRPGVLADMTRILSDAGINIKDIELLKIREGEGGMFRIGFASAEEVSDAAAALRQYGYSTRSA
ncbi:MAG: prephenate dehydrogenase/arogenate dehydrogenase family protein [Rhodothermales bacterium]